MAAPASRRNFDRNLLRAGGPLAPRVQEPVPFCWFCDAGSGKRATEHIFAKTLIKHFGAKNEQFQPHRITADGRLGSRTADRGPLALVAGEVCANCNNGWMSALEVAAKPLLTLTARDGCPALTPEDQSILARWFAKTAVALNVSQPFRLLFDAPTRHALTSHTPDNVVVSLLRVTRQNGIFDWAQGTVEGAIVPDHLSRERVLALQGRCYLARIRVADLAGEVLVLPSPLKPAHVRTDAMTINPPPNREVAWSEVPVRERYLDGLPYFDLSNLWVV